MNKSQEEFENQFSQVASLLGDKARSIMLWNLLDGRAYTATELSTCASISAQSASNHLAKLVQAQLLKVEKQGRHRYYTFAKPEVAQVIESLGSLLPPAADAKKIKKPQANGFTYARTCYDHLAGTAGVLITEALLKNQIIVLAPKAYELTPDGQNWFRSIGIDTDKIKSQKRSFAYPCLDWSERKHHIAGGLGAALLQTFLQKHWVRRLSHSRELILSQSGKLAFREKLGLNL